MTKQKQTAMQGARDRGELIVVNRWRAKLIESHWMQRRTEESEWCTEGDRENIRSPARETGTSWSTLTAHTCLCRYESVFVCKHTGMHVCMRGAELGQLLLLEPQLVVLSAEKGPEGMRRKEEEVWEKGGGGRETQRGDTCPYGEALGTWRQKKKGAEMTGRGTESRTRRQLLRRAVWSCWISSGNSLWCEGTNSRLWNSSFQH